MKISFTLIAIMLISSFSFAQIPNSGFENWTPDGSGVLRPDGWTTNSTTVLDLVTQYQPAFSGNYAMNITLDNDGINGSNGSAVAGFPCTTLPDAFSFYYKSDFTNGGSLSGFAAVYDSAFNTLAAAFINIFTTQADWTLITLPMDSFDTGTVDTALINLVIGGNIFTPSWIALDEMQFGIPTPVNAMVQTTESFIVLASAEIITVNYTLKTPGPVSLKLFDVLGNLVQEVRYELQQAGAQHFSFNATTCAPGLYVCVLERAGKREAKKVVVVH